MLQLFLPDHSSFNVFSQIIPFKPTQTVILTSLNFSTILLLRRFFDTELKITRKLKDIGIVWKKLELIYRAHKDTEIMLVTVTDDIIEALEDNQLELQTMIGMGKFVDHFRSEVEDWQYKLGQVETVLKIWSDVTKQWAALETIFLGSADIRAQLPEDTKRFEGIDSQFKDLCKSTEGVPNVIDACCQEGREELLIEMANNLGI